MDGKDQISQLPEPILEQILSFLVVKDAAKTSILSKALYNAWMSLSCLNFGDHDARLVDQILANRRKEKISIQKFMVSLPNHHAMYVDNWIKMLVECNIKEVCLEIERPEQSYNKLPEAIFAAKALSVLSLSGFNLELPSDGIKFSALRGLHLSDSFLNDQLLQAICTSCSDLEVLSLENFCGLNNLQVAGTLPKLRTIKLQFCTYLMVDIVAPALKDLCISYFHPDIHVLKLTSCKSLKHLKLINSTVTNQWLNNLLANLPNLEILYLDHCISWKSVKISSNQLKHLELIGMKVTDQWLVSFLSDLPNLEILGLFRCASLTTIKISSDRLKRLTALECCNLIVVDLDTPNLLSFSSDIRYGKEGFSQDVDLLPTLKLKASHMQEANLNLITYILDTDHWYSKLTKFLGNNFNHTKAIELSCDNDKVIVIPKDMRENLLPPLYGANSLRVNIKNRFKCSVSDIVDYLLWVSPQLDTLSFSETLVLKTVEFTYSDAADEDEKPCCASLPWKRRRHELTKVKLKNFTCAELSKMRNYFLTKTDRLEIIEDPPACSICTSIFQ